MTMSIPTRPAAQKLQPATQQPAQADFAQPVAIASRPDQVLFSGKKPSKRTLLQTLGASLAAMPLAGAALFAPTAASAATPSQAPISATVQTQPGELHPDVTPSGKTISFVDDASQIDFLSQAPTQTVFDLAKSPLLSNQTRQQLETYLDQYNAGNGGQMGVVVIPDTHQDQLAGLATNLGNRLGVGHDAQDDGMLMLINAQAVRENRASGRMFIATGSGVDNYISDREVTQLLADNALPNLERGDYDAAVRSTVEAVTQRLDEAIARGDIRSNGNGGWTTEQGDPFPWGKAGLIALYIIAGVAAAGGLGVAGAKGLGAKRRREEDAATINNALTQMGSSYEAGLMNVYKIETAKNLLAVTDKQADPQAMISALSVVDSNTKEDDAPTLRQLYIDNGIGHATPDVRMHAIEALNITEGSRELFEPLMTQLSQETEQRVIDTLETPLVAMANEDDVSKFAAGLDAENDGVRQVSVRVMSKFFQDEMMETFFTRLGKEGDADVVSALNEAIVTHADEKFSKTFLNNLKSESDNVRGTSVEGLGQLKNPANFVTLMDAFAAEKKTSLDARFTDALSATTTANKKQISGKFSDKLYTAIATKDSKRIQELGLSQLDILAESKHVPKLYEYLESSTNLSPQKAIAVLVNSVDKSNNALLLEKLGSKTANVRMASSESLGKLADPANVATLFTALEGEKEQGISGSLTNAILGTKLGSTENHQLLLNKMESQHTGVRMTAVKGLETLADPADLKALFKAMEKESNSDIANALMNTIVASGRSESAFGTLTAELSKNKNTNVQLAVVYALQNHGMKALDPLFEALGDTNNSSPRQLTDVLTSTLVSLGNQGDTLNYMLKKADSRHALVQDVGATVASTKIANWSRQYDYDNHDVMRNLTKLSRHNNGKISNTANQVYTGMVRGKLSEVSSLSSFSNYSYRSNRSSLQSIASNAFENQVKNAANSAISSLDSSKRRYDEEERRRQAAEAARAAAAAAAAARAASSSSSGGGGFGGGGFSGGGGGI